jgi:uncharacterized membrane protein
LSHLFVIAFPDEAGAVTAMQALQELQAQERIDLEDRVYVTHDAHGDFRLHQTGGHALEGAGRGGAAGVLLGALLAIPIALTAPAAAVLAAVIAVGGGAGVGALTTRLTDYGISDQFLESVAKALPPGSAAVFALVRWPAADQARPMLAKLGGTVLHTSMAPDAPERIKAELAAAQNSQRQMEA